MRFFFFFGSSVCAKLQRIHVSFISYNNSHFTELHLRLEDIQSCHKKISSRIVSALRCGGASVFCCGESGEIIQIRKSETFLKKTLLDNVCCFPRKESLFLCLFIFGTVLVYPTLA